MQTFIPFKNIDKTVQILDFKRLGKQRVEAIQIAYILLGLVKNRWSNHPAVRMWKGYEPYLVKVYLRKVMDEWIHRGYKNIKCEEHWEKLIKHPSVEKVAPITPHWLTLRFCRRHQSNLIRKFPEYYEKLFHNIPDNLPYIWPKNLKNIP